MSNVKADALGAPIPFEFEGEAYEVQPPAQWDLAALEAFEADKVVTCVRLILGAEQWQRFRAKPRTVADLNAMFQAIQAHTVGKGN